MAKGLTELLTVQEAAAIKEVDASSVRRALEDTRLKGEKIGRQWLILRKDLEAWTPERRGPKPRPKERAESSPIGLAVA